MIHALQAAARAARQATSVTDDKRGVVIVITEDALIVRGWDRTTEKGEARAVCEVAWLEFVANNDLVGNAVALVVERLDAAVRS